MLAIEEGFPECAKVNSDGWTNWLWEKETARF